MLRESPKPADQKRSIRSAFLIHLAGFYHVKMLVDANVPLLQLGIFEVRIPEGGLLAVRQRREIHRLPSRGTHSHKDVDQAVQHILRRPIRLALHVPASLTTTLHKIITTISLTNYFCISITEKGNVLYMYIHASSPEVICYYYSFQCRVPELDHFETVFFLIRPMNSPKTRTF